MSFSTTALTWAASTGLPVALRIAVSDYSAVLDLKLLGSFPERLARVYAAKYCILCGYGIINIIFN